MNGLDAARFVVLAHQWPIDASVIDVDLGLNIENACDASFHHGLCVLLLLWIRTNEYIGTANFIKSKSTDKICIGHFYMTIHDECILDVSPDV
jgi:hypothetical protein